MTDVSVTGSTNPGTAGTNATQPGQAGGPGGPGGLAIATNPGSTDLTNSAEAAGGSGGPGGSGGAGNAGSPAGGNAGAGGPGGNAAASATTAAATSAAASAAATAHGGAGGAAGRPGRGFTASATGHGASGGAPGTATAAATANNTAGYAAATASSYGGLGGSAYGAGTTGQAGGAASGTTAAATGKSAGATIKQAGGQGGAGYGGASGGAGAASALTDAATAATTGGPLRLVQTAYGGAGGAALAGSFTGGGGAAGIGGAASSMLHETDTLGATSVYTLAKAGGGAGGNAISGAAAAGGTALALATTHTATYATVRSIATGGQGGGYATGGSASGGAGGAVLGATASAYAPNTNTGLSYALAQETGGAGGVASGAADAGGAGGAVGGTAAVAHGHSAKAVARQTGGRGGDGMASAAGGQGAYSSLLDGVSAVTYGNSLTQAGPVTLAQYAYGGQGGTGGAAGQGGGAYSEFSFTQDTTLGSNHYGTSDASGGAGGAGTATGGAAGGAATAGLALAGGYHVAAHATAAGGAGGASTATGNGGPGGAAAIGTVTATAVPLNNGIRFYGQVARAYGAAVGGAGGAATGRGYTGGAGGVATIGSVDASEGFLVYASAAQTGGAGGAGQAHANGGAGADSTLTNAVSASVSRAQRFPLTKVTLAQSAYGGAGGASASGTPGHGGAAVSNLSLVQPYGAGSFFLYGHSYAVGGAGGARSPAGLGGAGGNANATIDLQGADLNDAVAKATGGAGGGGSTQGSAGTATAMATAEFAPGTGSTVPTLAASAEGKAGGTVTAEALSTQTTFTFVGPPGLPSFDTSRNAYVDGVVTPSGTDAFTAAAMGANATALATGEQTDTDSFVTTQTLNPAYYPSGGGFGIYLEDDAFSGAGFDTLSLTASYSIAGGGGGQLVDFSTGTLSAAQAFFTSDAAAELPFAALPHNTSSTVTITITLDETLSSGEGFSGLVLVNDAVACFAAGTRIATPRGAIKVEALREGDVVLTRDGAQPIVWLGHRRIDLARHPRPEQARPIKIRRHAFGDGAPARDLLVSPDHAIFHDGVLIPAKLLLNGSTVTQARPRSITYFHIELPRHDIVLAENLPAESYLDTGNRGMFANARDPFILHPSFVIHAWDDTCAPMVLDGEKLAAVRAHLLARAECLGHPTTDDPDLHLRADGRRIEVQKMPDGTLWLAIPAGARSLALVSRSAIPTEVQAASTDRRRLGVCVARLEMIGPAGRYDIPLTGPALTTGWHELEDGWRWTDGNAALAVQGPGLLQITLAGALRYRLAA